MRAKNCETSWRAIHSQDYPRVEIMTRLDCETIRMAAMAIADGQYSELSSQQIEEHLAGCDDCRIEMGQLLTLTNLLDNQKRRERTETVWPQVKGQLPDAQSTRQSWYPFLLLGV